MWRHLVVSGPALALTGTFSQGQAQVSGISSTAGVLVGSAVSGSPFVQPDSLVKTVDSPTQITLSVPAWSSGSAGAFLVANEPVTLAQARLHCRIPDTVTEDDGLLAGLIGSARRYVEVVTGLRLVTMTVDYFADNWPWLGGYYNRVIRSQAVMGPVPYWLPSTNTGLLDLHVSPIQSVSWVKYKDFNGVLQTIPSSQYIVEASQMGSTAVGPSRIMPAYGFTWPIPQPTIDSVNIRFVVGCGPDFSWVPDNLKAAMKLLIGYWYENRESGVVGLVSQRIVDGVDALCAPSMVGDY